MNIINNNFNNASLPEPYLKSKRWVNIAWYLMLISVLGTALNMVLTLIQTGRFYLCSLIVPSLFLGTSIIMSLICVVYLVPFILALVFMKKYKTWMIIAPFLIGLDTMIGLILICLLTMFPEYTSMFSSGEFMMICINLTLMIVEHIVIFVLLLISIVKSGEFFRVKKENPELLVPPKAPQYNPTDYPRYPKG